MLGSGRKARRFSSLRFTNGKVTNRSVSLNEDYLNDNNAFIVIDGSSITLSDEGQQHQSHHLNQQHEYHQLNQRHQSHHHHHNNNQVFQSSSVKEMNYIKSEPNSHPGSPPVITVRESSSATVNEKDDISLYGTPKEEMAPGFAEAKASFMRHQIEALFQPSDNKLAMKLFGSKKALMKERLRQKESGHWIIHPCSNFSN